MKTIDEVRRETELAALIADEQGYITHINPSFTAIFGWKPEEIIGKSLTIIIPKSLHDSHHLGFSRFLTTGVPTLLNQPLQLKAVKKNGEVFEAEHLILAEKQKGRWVFAATIRVVH